MYACMSVCLYVCNVCMHACIHVCMHTCMCVMYVCNHACMCVCIAINLLCELFKKVKGLEPILGCEPVPTSIKFDSLITTLSRSFV